MNFLMIESLATARSLLRRVADSRVSDGIRRASFSFTKLPRLSQRLSSLFLPDANGHRPVYGDNKLFQEDPNFRSYTLFYEFFHGDTGKGLGASHQTGGPDWWPSFCSKVEWRKG